MPFGNLAVATQHASRDSCEVHILTFYSTHSKPIHFLGDIWVLEISIYKAKRLGAEANLKL